MQDQKLKEAHRQVESERGFYIHAIIYALINSALWGVNITQGPAGEYWAAFPSLGWGIGLFFHGFGVFGKNVIFGEQWKQKRIDELMKK